MCSFGGNVCACNFGVASALLSEAVGYFIFAKCLLVCDQYYRLGTL